MTVYSFKLNRKVLIFALIAIIALIAVLLIATSGKTPDGEQSVNNDAATPQQRLAFIEQFGWETEPEPTEILDVYVPEEFNTVLQRYNAIQLAQGYDLTAYRGMSVQRYTYKITNYPDFNGEVFINLLVSDGKVIGGDICSRQLGGFIHGFSPKRVELSSATSSAESSAESSAQSLAESAPAAMTQEVSGPTD